MAASPPFRIPASLIVVDVAGALLAGLGMWGLIDPSAESRLGALAEPMTASLLLVAGLGMMGYAVFKLFRRARAATRAPPSGRRQA